MDSRVGLTSILTTAIQNTKNAPKIFVSGSAIGYYPNNIDGVYDESYNGAPATDFSGQLCAAWETASLPLETTTRRSIVRTGVVLASGEGALAQMLLPGGLAVAGTIGSGQQWMPWIHVNDLVEMFAFAIENESVKGILNGTAPENSTNADFASTLATVTNRWAVPTPEFVANFMFGERAPLLTRGSKVLPKRATQLGFTFQYRTLDAALRNLFPPK